VGGREVRWASKKGDDLLRIFDIKGSTNTRTNIINSLASGPGRPNFTWRGWQLYDIFLISPEVAPELVLIRVEARMRGVPTPSPERRLMLSRMGHHIRLSLGMGGRESDKAQYPSERPGKEGAACGLEHARLDSS
jgi:hypothetical protein